MTTRPARRDRVVRRAGAPVASGSLTSGKVPGGLDVLAPGIAGALERGQLPLQQLGSAMSRAVVLQDGDDHRAVESSRPVTTPSGTSAPSSARPITTRRGPGESSPAPKAPSSFRRPAGLAT